MLGVIASLNTRGKTPKWGDPGQCGAVVSLACWERVLPSGLIDSEETVTGTRALLCYKNENSHQNTAKKITHFPKRTLPKEGLIGGEPTTPPGEDAVTSRQGVSSNLGASGALTHGTEQHLLGGQVPGDESPCVLDPSMRAPGPLGRPTKPLRDASQQRSGGVGAGDLEVG